ncbi:hypothetical protein [Oleidesulfovibrio sp.]|uniref:hypothetical protein n=1 Tax=Oleidesulfovibrio sp. TaxID=2909707 RepID=UPI003A89C4A7
MNTAYMLFYSQKLSQQLTIQLAALSVVPAFLLSEKSYLGWLVIGSALSSQRIDFWAFILPCLSLVMIGFVGWAAWVFWKKKNRQSFRAFLFVWFWTSPFSSIVLLLGLMLVGLSPFGTPGDGSNYLRHPIRYATAPFVILFLILLVAWWAWRLIHQASNTIGYKENQ